MKLNNTRLALAVAAAIGVSAPAGVYATNGYFSHAYGTASGGMAGASVALPQDTLAAATNPAGMVFVGDRGDVGMAAFIPLREYTVTGTMGAFPPFPGGVVESGSNAFGVPSFGMNWMLDKDRSVGVSVYGNGGMNTHYQDSDTPFGMGTFGGAMAGDSNAGMDYMQLFIAPTYAQKIGANAAVGVSGIINYSRFRIDGLGGFAGFSTNPAKLSNNGYDSAMGIGVKVGIMGEVAPGLTLAGSYQSKVKNELKDYAGLFVDGGHLDIPPTATVGLAYKPNAQTAVTFDIQKIWYTKVDAIGNGIQNLFACMGGDMTQCLGGSNGAGFGWEDMTVYKLGVQHDTGNGWIWRGGFSTGNQPIPGGSDPMKSQTMFNILAPGVMEQHITFGFTRKLAGKKEFSMAFMYAPENTVSGVSAFVPTETIDLTMKQYQIEASFSW